MSKAIEFRKQAEEAGELARKSNSLTSAVLHRRRQRGLIQLANNEDWLDGKESAAPKI